MTCTKYTLISRIQQLVSQDQPVPGELFDTLRLNASDPAFVGNFDPEWFKVLVSEIFLKLDNLQDQLDIIRAISNILLMNEELRATKDESIVSALSRSIPNLTDLLDQVSERRINTESQYKDFLPIFRLFFLLTHNIQLIPKLKQPIIKSSKKLLNFVTLSSTQSLNLNAIIIEILKIVYSFVHQVEETECIDSPFVLSFNKFQIVYAKSPQNDTYDEILQHFGNVLMTINTEILKSYMMNILKFCQNEVCMLNRIMNLQLSKEKMELLTNSLLTLQVAISIDSEESGVKKYLQENLNISKLETFKSVDPNYPVILQQLKSELFQIDATTGAAHTATSPLSEFDKVLEQAVEANKISFSSQYASAQSIPRFEDLSNEEQNQELDMINDIFDKIEKNGVFKLQMK